MFVNKKRVYFIDLFSGNLSRFYFNRDNYQFSLVFIFSLEYSICGTTKRGYKVFRESGRFFIYPGVKLVSVICIGGGGGGYDVTNDEIVLAGKAGDGGDSSFGSHPTAFGGKGGSLTKGGSS